LPVAWRRIGLGKVGYTGKNELGQARYCWDLRRAEKKKKRRERVSWLRIRPKRIF
jgi:hypothetical protein